MIPGLGVQDVIILRTKAVEVEIVYQCSLGGELTFRAFRVRGREKSPAERGPIFRLMRKGFAPEIPVFFDDVNRAGDFSFRFSRPFIRRSGAHLEAIRAYSAVQQQRMAFPGALGNGRRTGKNNPPERRIAVRPLEGAVHKHVVGVVRVVEQFGQWLPEYVHRKLRGGR